MRSATVRSQRFVSTTVLVLATVALAACGSTQPQPMPQPTPQPTPQPCAGVSCSGNGSCAVVSGNPTCACNSGFHAEGLSCVANACVPQCGSRVCGGSNGCGQSCGTCSGTDVCTAAGQCQPAAPSSASLKVVNNSSISLYYLYASPCGTSTWGPDQLGSKTISPGGAFTLTGFPCPACYDLKVEGSGHTVGATRYGNNFSCGSTLTWTLTN